MEVLIRNLIESIVSNFGVFVIWALTASYILYVVYKTKLYGLLIILAGIVPSILFQASRLSQPWIDISPYDIFYSRVSELSLAFSIFLAMRMMFREWTKRWT